MNTIKTIIAIPFVFILCLLGMLMIPFGGVLIVIFWRNIKEAE